MRHGRAVVPENGFDLEGYLSDFDLLVMVSHEKLTDIADYWYVAEDNILRDPAVGPVTCPRRGQPPLRSWTSLPSMSVRPSLARWRCVRPVNYLGGASSIRSRSNFNRSRSAST